jgi:cytoskeleton protein RodZ
MSDNKKSSESLSPAGSTPGEILVAKRKKLGIDEKEAAEALKISVNRLRLIESNNYSDFPSETYIRGYLKNYGRFLKVSEQQIMEAYEQCRPTQFQDVQPREETHAVLVHSNSHKQWWFVYVVLVVLVLLWVVSYWLFGRGADEDRDAALTPYSEIVPSSEPPLGMPQQGSSQMELPITLESQSDNYGDSGLLNLAPANDATEGDNEADVRDSKATENTSSKANTDEAIVVSKVTAAEIVKSVIADDQGKTAESDAVEKGDSLTFGFDNDCWIKVTDAKGAVIFVGLKRSGTQLSLKGKAPFRVVVGNVEGTTMVYNGVPVQLTAQAGRKSISLRVGG